MSDQEFIQEEQEDVRLNEDFLMSLRDFMDQEEIKEMDIKDTDTFSIQSKEQANYFVKKLLEIRSQQEEVNRIADYEINKTVSRVNQWREEEIRKTQRDEEYITGLLRSFAEKELANAKSKSIKLPFGSIGFKKQQPKFEYNDEALIAQLEADESLKAEYVQYKATPKKGDLKKAGEVKDNKLYVNGKLIEGVTITPQDEKFEIK